MKTQTQHEWRFFMAPRQGVVETSLYVDGELVSAVEFSPAKVRDFAAFFARQADAADAQMPAMPTPESTQVVLREGGPPDRRPLLVLIGVLALVAGALLTGAI